MNDTIIENPHIKRKILAKNPLNELKSIAWNYIETYNKIHSYDPKYMAFEELKQKIKSLSGHEFFIFLNDNPNFIIAKEILTKAKLITSHSDSTFDSPYPNILEFVTANAIMLCTTSDLNSTNVIKKRNAIMDDALFERLTVMSRNFENESEEYLFLTLLNILKSSAGSIYNSGKRHELIIREVMSKKIVQQLFTIFKEKISSTTATDITMNIVCSFFEECMSRSDLISIATKIKENVQADRKIHEMTVGDYISSQSRINFVTVYYE